MLQTAKQKMKRKSLIKLSAGIILAGSLANCATFEHALGNMLTKSDAVKPAVSRITRGFVPNSKNGYYIETFDFFDKTIDTNEEIAIYIHGWANSANDFIETGNANSKLNTARKVYPNIWLANYPSNTSLEKICKNMEIYLEKNIEKYIESNPEHKSPSITLIGQSAGTLVSRYLARKYPEVKKAALVGGPHDGANFGIFDKVINKIYDKSLSQFLKGKDMLSSPESYQSYRDLLHGSEFLNELNTPTSLLDKDYYFFAFQSDKGSNFIPGKDDQVVPSSSAYPYKLMKEGKFENVRVKKVVFYEGDVTHFSLVDSPDILEQVLRIVKSNDRKYFFYSTNPILPKKATIIHVLECDAREKYLRSLRNNVSKEEMESFYNNP